MKRLFGRAVLATASGELSDRGPGIPHSVRFPRLAMYPKSVALERTAQSLERPTKPTILDAYDHEAPGKLAFIALDGIIATTQQRPRLEI
jgi:hypothetical protein